MANQVAARLAGDDYQHLLAWLQILEIQMPGSQVRAVIVEDPDAAHVDDITTLYEKEADHPDEFLQVKYHVDHREQYTTDFLLQKATEGSRSLLEKFFATWNMLRKNTERGVELRLLSNWTWDASDDFAGCIQGKNNSLSEEFFTAGGKSNAGKVRERWRAHLAAEPVEFVAFARTLRFRLGFDCFDEVAKRLSERMMFLKLRSDRSALLVAVGIVRDLIKAGNARVTRAELETLLNRYDLFLPPDEDPATVVYLTTVKKQQFDFPPDFHLDWRDYFEGAATKKGHTVTDPSSWNARMLPELQRLEADLNGRHAPRLIKARGLARLSAWFALGHTFSDVARYTIEVDQQAELWRTDAVPTELETLEARRADVPDGDPSTVAVGISITGALDADVEAYVTDTRSASKILFLHPNRELGRTVFTSAGDVVGFARTAKERMRAFVKEHQATRLVVFYFGPLSGACFIGHQLNAIAREVQIMEDQQPGYAPAFLLT
jgi:SMODS-associated and fused to various effectors sensor domain